MKRDPWNGVTAGDKQYQAIGMSVLRIQVHYKQGNLYEIVDTPSSALVLKSKSIKVGTLGRTVLDTHKKMRGSTSILSVWLPSGKSCVYICYLHVTLQYR
jgi:hypothetical protein